MGLPIATASLFGGSFVKSSGTEMVPRKKRVRSGMLRSPIQEKTWFADLRWGAFNEQIIRILTVGQNLVPGWLEATPPSRWFCVYHEECHSANSKKVIFYH